MWCPEIHRDDVSSLPQKLDFRDTECENVKCFLQTKERYTRKVHATESFAYLYFLF